MTNSIAMENPDNPPGLIATIISDYWPYVASIGTVILSGTTWGYVKFARRKGISVWGWFSAAVAAPMAIAQLRANMVDRAEFDGLNAKVQDMRTMMVRETATRRALLQHSDTAFFEADKNGRVVWVNTAYLTMVDRELHEVTENNWRNSIH